MACLRPELITVKVSRLTVVFLVSSMDLGFIKASSRYFPK